MSADCSSTNIGPGAARNLGAAKATGDILVFVDADVALHPDALGRVAKYYSGPHSCAAVIGSYDNDPKAKGFISQYRNLLHRFVHQKTAREASHFWTGIGAVERSAFEALGGFDEARFGRALEDVEFGYRLRDAGYCIRVDPDIQGRHLKHWTLGSMLRTDLFVRAIPWTQLLLSHREMPNDFSLGLAQRASVFLAWLLPVSVVLAGVFPPLMGMTGAAFAAFLMVNWNFFRNLKEERGWAMALAAVSLHWLYHFISGLGFLLGSIVYVRRQWIRSDEKS